MSRKTRIAAALLAVAFGGTLVGCGGGGANQRPAPRFHTYVALGDSYTAAPLVPSPQGDDDGCFRSDHNYPSLVAVALRVPDFRDRSCGGAQSEDLTRSQMSGVPPQLDAVDGDTKLVTLSIGGNDSGVFGTLMAACSRLGQLHPTGSPCADAARAKAGQLDQLLNASRDQIVHGIELIRTKAPEATVLVVGYPQIFPTQGACPDRLPFAAGDYRFALGVNRSIDDALRAAARTTHTTFVNVWQASAGHDICSSSPWVNGGTTLPEQAAAFHPFGVEQQAVAQLVLKALD